MAVRSSLGEAWGLEKEGFLRMPLTDEVSSGVSDSDNVGDGAW